MKNVPRPTELEIGTLVRFKKRTCIVVVESFGHYMIRDIKNRSIWWIKPEQVEIVTPL